MSSLAGSSVLTAMAPLPPFRSTAIEEIEAEVPELLDTHLATLQDVLDRADVICEVVDARDILGGRSSFLEGLVQDAAGRVVLVVNKIGESGCSLPSSMQRPRSPLLVMGCTADGTADLVPRETLRAWLSHLTITTCLFSSHSTPAASTSSSTTPPVFGRQELLAFFRKLAAEKTEDDLVIAFMGLTSVGKTSIVNSLLSPSQKRHSVAPIVPSANSAKHPAPTTSAPVELLSDIGEGKRVRVIDTPGWGYVEDEVEEDRDEDGIDVLEERLAADLLRQNLGRVDRVKDALPLGESPIRAASRRELIGLRSELHREALQRPGSYALLQRPILQRRRRRGVPHFPCTCWRTGQEGVFNRPRPDASYTARRPVILLILT